MESPSSQANSVAMSSSSSKNDEDVNLASNPEVNSSASLVAIPPYIPNAAQEPVENLNVANINEIPDYGCKYCEKRFSNKQALGGHQNAHKTVRTMEKIEELYRNRDASLRVLSYPVMASPPTFPDSFHHRAMINRPHQAQLLVHHGVHIDHYAHPMLPMAAIPHTPRPLYPGWSVQIPRVLQFMVPMLHMPYTPGFAPMGMGSSSARPVLNAHPNFTNFIPSRDPGGRNKNQMNNNSENLEDEDSGLDLSLRL